MTKFNRNYTSFSLSNTNLQLKQSIPMTMHIYIALIHSFLSIVTCPCKSQLSMSFFTPVVQISPFSSSLIDHLASFSLPFYHTIFAFPRMSLAAPLIQFFIFVQVEFASSSLVQSTS